MKITASTPIKELTSKELTTVVINTVQWCFNNLKQPRRHRVFAGIRLTMPEMHVFISRKRVFMCCYYFFLYYKNTTIRFVISNQ